MNDLAYRAALILRALAPDMPPPQHEHRFAPPRRWRFDLAWPESRVAVEVEGGAWVHGRHVRPEGYARDCAKYNAAALGGWTVLRFTPEMLERDPQGFVDAVREALGLSRSPRVPPGTS